MMTAKDKAVSIATSILDRTIGLQEGCKQLDEPLTELKLFDHTTFQGEKDEYPFWVFLQCASEPDDRPDLEDNFRPDVEDACKALVSRITNKKS